MPREAVGPDGVRQDVEFRHRPPSRRCDAVRLEVVELSSRDVCAWQSADEKGLVLHGWLTGVDKSVLPDPDGTVQDESGQPSLFGHFPSGRVVERLAVLDAAPWWRPVIFAVRRGVPQQQQSIVRADEKNTDRLPDMRHRATIRGGSARGGRSSPSGAMTRVREATGLTHSGCALQNELHSRCRSQSESDFLVGALPVPRGTEVHTVSVDRSGPLNDVEDQRSSVPAATVQRQGDDVREPHRQCGLGTPSSSVPIAVAMMWPPTSITGVASRGTIVNSANEPLVCVLMPSRPADGILLSGEDRSPQEQQLRRVSRRGCAHRIRGGLFHTDMLHQTTLACCPTTARRANPQKLRENIRLWRDDGRWAARSPDGDDALVTRRMITVQRRLNHVQSLAIDRARPPPPMM